MAKKEYIERDGLLEWAREFYPNDKQFISAVLNARAADVEPVRHGRWEWGNIYDYGDLCSICHYDSCAEPCKYKYCPNCGAKMDGKEQENA